MKHRVFFITLTLFSFYFFGCEESLPPREQPPVLYSITTSASYYYYTRGALAGNRIDFTFVVKNIYDETIQDTLDFGGSITITWLAATTPESSFAISKTVQLDRTFIKYMRGYNSATGVLTFDPQDSLVIGYGWNFITDDNTNLLEYFPAFPRGGEEGCRITPRQTVRAFASIRLVKSGANIVTRPFDYTHCFFTADGEPPCSDFIWDPCN